MKQLYSYIFKYISIIFSQSEKKTLSIMLCVLKRRVHKIQNFNEEITTLSPLCKHVNCYLTCNCIESVYSMPKFMFQKPTNKSDSVGCFLFTVQNTTKIYLNSYVSLKEEL